MTMRSASILWLLIVTCVVPQLVQADEEELQEVVVTAQKRQERLVDVPMALTVVSGPELAQKTLQSMQDLSFAVPGMTTREDGPGSYTIFMRGVSNDYGTGALVGQYLDEVPVTLTGYDQLDVRPLDLERVEVLKGPQGTLYGQGSVVGTVRYITEAPDLHEYAGRIEGDFATIDSGSGQQIFRGIANLPVVNNVLGVRLAVWFQHGGGWQDQPPAGIYNGNYQDLKIFQLKTLWKVSDALDIKLMAIVHRNESKLGQGYENPDRTIYVAIDPATQLIPKQYDYDLYNLDIKYNFGSFELVSSSSEIFLNHHYPDAYEGGPETIYAGALSGNGARHVDNRQFSQELRLVSTSPGPFKWTVGGFYRNDQREYYELYDTEYAGAVFTDQVYSENETYNSSSIFADVSYDITHQFTLGAGVRYFNDNQGYLDNSGVGEKHGHFHSTDPRVYATYKISENVNTYASVSKGFRSGGFNYGDLPNYGPESLINYEIGTKGTTAGGRLAFELSGYYSDYSDMLRRGLLFIPSSGLFQQLVSNIGKVHIKGVEGGLTWRATRQLTVNTTASYIDSKIVEVNAQDATNIAGDPVDYVPKFALTAGANYSFHWASQIPGYIRLDYMHRDKVNYVDRTSFPPENLPQTSDVLDLLNGRLGATWGKLDLEVYGTNLTNQNAWVDPEHAWRNANRTRPRLVGVMVGYSFE